ncbi:uncharacterized protein BDV14DRAFT_112776 [Aspergillus stella-maris]|uniref:uncharacterized protein n=1 Tax=Aspergillus stella-maris TaxID=1810926 RepID=UPI003CCE5190
MDGSLQVDTRHDVKSTKHSGSCEATAKFKALAKLEHYSPRHSPSVRPLSLDAARNTHPDLNRSPADSQEWPLKASAAPFKEDQLSQDKLRRVYGIDPLALGELGVTEPSDSLRLESRDYMGPSTNTPRAHPLSDLDGFGRRRSQSIGSGPRGSRLAALSVQLRTRLSYAAAKIEKKRHSQTQQQSAMGFLQKNSSTPTLSVETLSRAGLPLSIGDLDDQHFAEIGSPNGTTVSAPGAPPTSNPHPFDPRSQPSLASSTSGLYPQPHPDLQKHFRRSSSEQAAPIKLAPPVDIGPSRSSGQRRRPNPNLAGISTRYEPFPRHGRHRSQHEIQADSDVERVPETPPLRHSTLNSLSQFNGLCDNPQNSSMEQDAIETLLFMSSPGTSGYHSNSQNSQRNQDVRNIDGSFPQSSQWHENIDGSHPKHSQPGPHEGRAILARDEIDHMLDQMNSDSEDDAKFTSSRSARFEHDSTGTAR